MIYANRMNPRFIHRLRKKSVISSYYAVLDPNEVFGMVGRCGGGYNTVWEDWSPEGRKNREMIVQEFELMMNIFFGHYEKLEQSILKEGIQSPLIVTCGFPLYRSIKHLPPELQLKQPKELLLLEGGTGGSRLWIAQKHNIPIPCIVNDKTDRFILCAKIKTVKDASALFKYPPKLLMTPKYGIQEIPDTATHTHLDIQYQKDSTIVEGRAIIYYNIMKKYGYNVILPATLRHLIK